MAINFNIGFKRDSLCVDLGNNSIKVLKLTKGRSSCVAEELIVAETGYDPLLPEEDFSKKKSQILASIWKEHNFKSRDVAVCVPGRGALVRHLRIPRVSDDRLDRIVRFEAKQQIPFPLDQVILDYHVFDTQGPELEVTLIAIRLNAIEDQVEILREARLRPAIIDVSSLCLFNALSEKEFEEDEVVGIVNIGAAETDIIIERNRVLKFIRSARAGGNHLTESIAEQMELSFAEAEERKIAFSAANTHQDLDSSNPQEQQERALISRAINDGMEAILTEIRRSIDFYISQPEGVALNRILITGGTSRIPDIASLFEERIGVPVEKARSFEQISLDTASINIESLEEISPIVLGLGLRAIDAGLVQLNFIPPSVRESKEVRSRAASFVIQLTLFILTVLMLVLHVNAELDKYDEANAFLEDIYKTGKVLGKHAQRLIEERKNMTNRFQILDAVGAKRGRLAKLLFEVARIAPPEIWLTELNAGHGNFELRGKCEYDQSSKINEFLEILNLDPFFGAIRCEDQRPSGLNYMEFRIIIDELKEPKPDEVKLVRVLTEKKIDVLFAQLVDVQGKFVAELALYGSMDIEENNAKLPEIVDALISSEIEFARVMITWVSGLRKLMYSQRANYAKCESLQKDQLSLEEFVNEVRFKNLEEEEQQQEGQEAENPSS